MATPPPHLLIEGLKVGFRSLGRHKDVLDLDYLEVRRGESYGLVGESGSGKTVLALSIARLLRVPPAEISADTLILGGHDVMKCSKKEMRRIRGREVAIIFQDPMSSLNPVFTVGSQLIGIVRKMHGRRGGQTREKALELIKLVGLPDPVEMLEKYPHQLSGGQRQRIIIAMALACEPEFLIADEPTRNLDVTVQAGVLKTMTRLKSDLDASLLFIANNFGLISAVCDRVGILLDGTIVESGTVDEVLEDPIHPYTKMLLRAVPSADERAETGINNGTLGQVVTGTGPGSKVCPYFKRCEESVASCSTARPSRVNVGGTHEVACCKPFRKAKACMKGEAIR
jgi:oligopeptide/dipeptide ABC transporter ATP-binding protein